MMTALENSVLLELELAGAVGRTAREIGGLIGSRDSTVYTILLRFSKQHRAVRTAREARTQTRPGSVWVTRWAWRPGMGVNAGRPNEGAASTRRRVLQALRDGVATRQDLADELGVAVNAISQHLYRLVAAKLVERTGRRVRGVNGQWRVLWGRTCERAHRQPMRTQRRDAKDDD